MTQTPVVNQYNYPIYEYNKSQIQNPSVVIPTQPNVMPANLGYVPSYGGNVNAGTGYHQQIFSNYAQSYNPQVYVPPVYVPQRNFEVPPTYNLSGSTGPLTFTNPTSNNNDIHKATLSKID